MVLWRIISPGFGLAMPSIREADMPTDRFVFPAATGL